MFFSKMVVVKKVCAPSGRNVSLQFVHVLLVMTGILEGAKVILVP